MALRVSKPAETARLTRFEPLGRKGAVFENFAHKVHVLALDCRMEILFRIVATPQRQHGAYVPGQGTFFKKKEEKE